MKRPVAKLLVALGCFLVALVGAELVARAAGVSTDTFAPWTTYVMRGEEEWELPPGTTGVLVQPSTDPELEGIRGEFVAGIDFRWCYDVSTGVSRPYMDDRGCVQVHINDDNLRGPRVPFEKEDGVYRVAVVGDSFTMGHGVPFEATYPVKLQVLANETLLEGGAAQRCETINLGIAGFDVRDVLRYARHKAMRYDPDLILYGFFLNDVFVGQVGEDQEEWRGMDLHEQHDKMFGEPTGLARYSRLVELWDKWSAQRWFSARTQEVYRSAFEEDSPHWKAWSEHLLQMHAAVDQHGVDFAVAIFPELTSLDDAYPFSAAHAAVAALCAENDIPCFDLLDAYRGQDAASLWVHPTDHHPNEIAHQIAADRIASEIRPFLLGE